MTARTPGKTVLGAMIGTGLVLGALAGGVHAVSGRSAERSSSVPPTAKVSDDGSLEPLNGHQSRQLKQSLLELLRPDLPSSAQPQSAGLVAFAFDDGGQERARADEPDQLESVNLLVADADPSRSWRLYIAAASDLPDSEPVCDTLMRHEIFVSCELTTLGGTVAVKTVTAVPTDDLQLTDDPPSPGLTQFDQSYATTSPSGHVIAFHEVVNVPIGTDPSGLFVTPASDVEPILSNVAMGDLVT